MDRGAWRATVHGFAESDTTTEQLTPSLFRPSSGSHLIQNGNKGFPVAQKAPPKQAPGTSWTLSCHLASSLSQLGCSLTTLPAAP